MGLKKEKDRCEGVMVDIMKRAGRALSGGRVIRVKR